nr:hypothetical protein [Tanacetum cinerariifolium]
GSGTPTEPHHTPSPEAQPSSHTHISSPILPTVTLIPSVTLTDTPIIRQYTKRTRIAQSSVLLPVADKPASPLRDVSQGKACPTDSGLIVDQDRATIAKSSTLPYDSAPRVTSLAADEGSLQLRFLELTEFCTSLQRKQSKLVSKFAAQALEITKLKARVKLDEGEVATERVSDDTEDIRRGEGEVAAERVSDDTEEMATVLITMDAVSVLLSRGVQVVPTAAAVAPANLLHTQGEREKKDGGDSYTQKEEEITRAD